MPRRAARVGDLRDAGFHVTIASGSVEAEEAALELARQQASPEAVQADVDRVAREVARAAAGAPSDELADIVTRAAQQALDHIGGSRNRTVAFHERALEIARSMPDVMVVTGHGVEGIYVACKPDGTGWDEQAQETLDSLAKLRD